MAEPAETIPFDPTNVADFMRQRATVSAVETYDEDKVDPERAARAIELGKATGNPAGPIYEDLDNFEKQTKQSVASDIIGSNEYIQNYINKYALATKVSSDDWGQLNDFVASAAGYGTASVLDKAVSTFREAYDQEHIDAETRKLEQMLRQNPFIGNYAAQVLSTDARDIASFLHGFSALIAGGAAGAGEAGVQLGLWSQANAARLTRDLVAMANVAMSGQGIFRAPLKPGAKEQEKLAARAQRQPEGQPTADQGIVIGNVVYPPETFTEVRNFINKFEPYLRDGDAPPRGLDAFLDEFWREQAKTDAENLKAMEQAADASQTSQRAADVFAEHISGPATNEQKLGVNAKVVGDALDEVPGVAEQKAVADRANADIVIPVSEWLKLDPEVRDQLRDHVRARQGGFTVDETKLPEQPGEPIPPPPKFLTGDNAVDALRTQGGLDELNVIQERKLNLTRTADKEGRVAFDLVDDLGERVGNLDAILEGTNLHIAWVGAGERIGEGIKAFLNYIPNSIGPRAIRDLLHQLRQEFPEAKTISGDRVTGARQETGKEGLVKIPLRGQSYADLREFIETIPGWKVADTSVEAGRPTLTLPPGADTKPSVFADREGGQVPQIASYTVRQAVDHLDPTTLRGVPAALVQFLGERLKESIGDMPIRVVTREVMDQVVFKGKRDRTPGYYSPSDHHVVMAEDTVNGVRGGERYATHWLMHEMGHAYTSRVIGTDVRVTRDIRAIMKEMEDSLLTLSPTDRARFDYAFTSAQEFMAEAWGNRAFQERLAELPMSPKLAEALGMKGEKGTIWDAVRKIIGDLLERLVGRRPENSMLDGLMKISERIEGRLVEAPEFLQPGERFMKGREWIYDESKILGGEAKEPELPMIGTTRLEDMPVFKQATAAGITAPMLKGILKRIQEKFTEDNTAELKRVQAEEARRQGKEWRENRAEVMKDASTKVYDLPDVKADELLRTGFYMGHKFGKFRLDTEGLTPEQQAAIPSAYLAKKFTKKSDIITKDDMAAMVGLDSGDILIERLSALDSVRKEKGLEGKAFIDDIIKKETDKMMEAKYGKLKENIQLNTMDRVFNETQLDFMHEWLVALAEKNKLEFSFTKAQVTEGLQREFDSALLGTIRSKDYINHAGKAVRGMTEQFIKENPAEAFKKQQEQYFATTTAKIAAKFELQMEDLRDTAKKFKPDIRKGVNQEYTNQIHRLLNDAGFTVHRTRPEIVDAIQKDSPGRESLRDFIEDKKMDGWEIDAPDWVDEGGNIPQFKNMTNGMALEFKELIDSLEHIGRAVEKIEVAGEKRDFLEWKETVIDTIKQLPERKEESQGRWLWQADASMTRMEEMIKDLDLRQELGPLFNAVIVPMMRSKAKEFDLITDLSNYFKEVRGEFSHKWRKSLNDDIPQDFIINPYNDAPYKLKRSNLINIMLNWGNPSNRWKFSAGYASRLLGRKAKPEEIAAFEAKTTELINSFAKKEDWDYVQAMWTPFKKWQPMMDTVARNTTGVSPRWIQGDTITTPYGDIEGGYWPVKYSRFTSTFDLVKEREDAPDRLFSHNYFPAATSKGHLKERTRFIDSVDINTSLEQAAGVMQQTIHDIAFRDALIQVNKIFRDKDIRKAATNHYGQEYVEQWMPWLKRIANKNVVDEQAMKAWNRYQNAIRVNLIGHALPLNLRVILSPDVGALNPKAMTAFNSNRAANVKFVMETSDEVRHLVYNIDRDFREQLEKISTKLDWSAFQRRAVQFGFAPVMKASQDFRMVTFYDKFHEAKAAGRSDAEAKTIADSFVRERHGAASVVDLPAVMSASETWKSLTMFYSYFNMTQNWQRQIPGNIKRGEWGKATVNFYGSVLVSAAFGALLFNQAKEGDSWFKIIGKALALQPLMGIPLLGPAANWWFEGFQPRTPHEGIVNAAFDVIKDVEKMYNRKPIKHPVRHLANMVGMTTGLPLAQIGRTGEFLHDVYTGEQRPRDFTDWARGIISGEARLKK